MVCLRAGKHARFRINRKFCPFSLVKPPFWGYNQRNFHSKEHPPWEYAPGGAPSNASFADFACDALILEALPCGVFLTGMQLDYTGECRPGETLSILTSRTPEGGFVKGVDGNGKTRFETQLIFGNVLA